MLNNLASHAFLSYNFFCCLVQFHEKPYYNFWRNKTEITREESRREYSEWMTAIPKISAANSTAIKHEAQSVHGELHFRSIELAL